MVNKRFDVFLAHNSFDKPLVRVIAKELRRLKVEPWLDEDQILPGQYFQDSIQHSLLNVNSAAICIGRSGLGPWQRNEIRAFVSQCTQREIPLIPVLLPGVCEVPEALPFLRESLWVSFENGIDDDDALLKLVRGIFQDTELTREKLLSNCQPESDTLPISYSHLYLEIESLKELQESKKFIATQLSRSLDSFKDYVKTLEHQKRTIESKLESIGSKVSSIEAILYEQKDAALAETIDWLSSEKGMLAEMSVKYLINNASEISHQLSNSYTEIIWTLENLVEAVRQYLLADEDDFLFYVEKLKIEDSYRSHTLEGIKYIASRVKRQRFPEDVSRNIEFAFSEIIECLIYPDHPLGRKDQT